MVTHALWRWEDRAGLASWKPAEKVPKIGSYLLTLHPTAAGRRYLVKVLYSVCKLFCAAHAEIQRYAQLHLPLGPSMHLSCGSRRVGGSQP